MTLAHYLGAVIVLIIITSAGIYSGKKVKSAQDFTTGGKSTGAGIIAGSLIGTLVGGASTIGTAQLAFTYGFSSWWFTLGGGLGLLIMAIIFVKPLYNSNSSTISQILSKSYGKRIATISAILMSIGTFLSIVSQLLSGVALVTSISAITSTLATIVIVIMMIAYVVFGGVWGAGLVGIIKTILLYVATIVCGVVSLKLVGGISGFTQVLPVNQYFNLFARGYWKDGGALISLVFGVLTTQSYVQAVISAKDIKTAKIGAITAGVLTPIIGISGIFVGMYMRISHPNIVPSTALPAFVLNYLPPVLGGVILATLLVALVGTGAGLSLGLSSIICNDIYKVYFDKESYDKNLLRFSRIVITSILVVAALFTFGNMGSLILNWSFMSMGLRGAVAFAPLCFALFPKGKVNEKCVLAAVIMGPIAVLLGKVILPEYVDSLFLGIGVSLLLMIIGYKKDNYQKN